MSPMTVYLSLMAAAVAMIMFRTAYRAIRVTTRFSAGPDPRFISGIYCTRKEFSLSLLFRFNFPLI